MQRKQAALGFIAEKQAALDVIAGGDLDYPVDTDGDDVAGLMNRSVDSLFAEFRFTVVNEINSSASRLTHSYSGLYQLSKECV
ncbi:MAG: hypothetical protein KTR32_16615 [Granulosicoccus sp.]|nr:hypothetical protein [Granulosicoccus sp.]